MAGALVMMISCSPAYAQAASAAYISDDDSPKSYSAFIGEASRRFGIPAPWIRAVMDAESGGNARAMSPKGAVGLMQIMPETWSDLRQRYRLGTDPYDAHDNIFAGAVYLRELLDRYGSPGFIAAYNAGPSRWQDHLRNGNPLPLETQNFLSRLAAIVGGDATDGAVHGASVAPAWPEASLFPKHPTDMGNFGEAIFGPSPSRSVNSDPTRDQTGLVAHSNGLFVVLTPSAHSQ